MAQGLFQSDVIQLIEKVAAEDWHCLLCVAFIQQDLCCTKLMNATFLRDEGIVKQLPTGCESGPPYCRASYLRTLWRCYNTDQRDYVEHNWTLWFRSHGGL